MRKLLLGSLLLLLTACSTVTLTPKGQAKYETSPTYQERLPFFLAGIIGEKEIDVKEMCGKRSIRQIQTQNTFMDSFLSIVTLSIYSPRTVRVWCDEGGA
jgi:hypothetical protein